MDRIKLDYTTMIATSALLLGFLNRTETELGAIGLWALALCIFIVLAIIKDALDNRPQSR